ncbi:MAG: transglutaminase domain-containing protein [Flavobacteriales bacterium]
MSHLTSVVLFMMLCLSTAKSGAQDSTRYAELDAYALAVPDFYSNSVDTLVAYLIIPARDENEKARLIFSWIAQHLKYDDRAINSNRTSDFSVQAVLKRKKAVCLGYASLFEAMCTEANLNARTIVGYSKHDKRGKKLKNPDHAWNAVETDGRWLLCDVTWGSGYAEPRKNGKVKTVKFFNNFWFDTQPNVFVLTHLPDVQRWQLLSSPVTKKQFENFPLVYSAFFQCGFTVDTIYHKLLNISKYEVTEVLTTKHPWHVVEAPATGRLLKGQLVNIVISSPVYDKLVVINGNNKPVFIEFIGHTAAVPVVPTGNKLSIYVVDNDKPRKAEGILIYKVVRQ